MINFGLLNFKLLELVYIVAFGLSCYTVYTECPALYITLLVAAYICYKVVRSKTADRIDAKKKAVFITGCDTGFGHDVAVRLDELGFVVFAGCLKPDQGGAKKLRAVSSKRLHVVPLDVRSDESVEAAHGYVVKSLPSGGLWAIVNNAGFNIMGDVELLTVGLYNKCMDVNFYGAVRTMRRFLYLVREKKGRVVIMSSVKGRSSWPANAAYHVTKHALETFADSMRMEMVKFGVRVSLVEPGNFSNATACQSEEVFQRYTEEIDELWNAASPEVRKAYGREYVDNMLAQQRTSIGGGGQTTQPVIDVIDDAICSTRPHTRYMVEGSLFDYHTIISRYYDVLPTWFTDVIIQKLTGCDHWPDYGKMKKE